MSRPGVSIYLLKVNNRNISKIYEICLKLKIETPEPHRWRCSSLFIVIFEQLSQVFLVFTLLTLKKLMLVTSWRLVNVTYQSIFTKNIELKITLNFPIFCCAYSNIIPLLLKKSGYSKKSSLVFQSQKLISFSKSLLLILSLVSSSIMDLYFSVDIPCTYPQPVA